jgi:hypothetical protein
MSLNPFFPVIAVILIFAMLSSFLGKKTTLFIMATIALFTYIIVSSGVF